LDFKLVLEIIKKITNTNAAANNPPKYKNKGRHYFCNAIKMKKALRETQTLRAGCGKVRTLPARPSARPLSQTHRQESGPITIHCAAAS